MGFMITFKQLRVALTLGLVVAIAPAPVVLATQATSTNYGVSEVRFGSGGELHACSTLYCAKQSAGELTVGNTKSTNYQAQAGGETVRDPFLEVSVSGAAVNLGTLDTTTVKTGSTTFSIKTYLSSGYAAYIDGTSLKNSSNGYVLTPMATATGSAPGTEQFGINLRQNFSPAVGANPVQIPSSTFSFGAAASGYNTGEQFRFVANTPIASSTSSSGQTDFTMSMIANIGTTTPSGNYGGRLVVNVVPSF